MNEKSVRGLFFKAEGVAQRLMVLPEVRPNGTHRLIWTKLPPFDTELFFMCPTGPAALKVYRVVLVVGDEGAGGSWATRGSWRWGSTCLPRHL